MRYHSHMGGGHVLAYRRMDGRSHYRFNSFYCRRSSNSVENGAFLAMLATIISALSDSLLKAIFGWISAELEKRNLIAQGKSQQYTADLQAAVKEASDAAQIRAQVAADPQSAIDADLRRLRDSASRGS